MSRRQDSRSSVSTHNDFISSSPKTATLLAESFMHRIAMGLYAEGDMLPSCRQVARDLNVTKDTANKAYKILERLGVVNTLPGKGVFVSNRSGTDLSESSIQQGLDAFVWQAKAMGIEEDRLRQMIINSIYSAYGTAQIKVAYIGLDQAGASDLAREIENYLNLPVVTPVLLTEFEANPRHFIDTFDILATSFSYLASVNHVAESLQATVVGVHTIPVSDDVLRIANARKGSRIGVVCSQEPNLDPLINLLKTYNHDAQFYPCLETDTEKLLSIVSSVDWVVDTLTSHQFVVECCPEVPVITVTFRIEEQSLGFLKDKILEIFRQRYSFPIPQNDTAIS